MTPEERRHQILIEKVKLFPAAQYVLINIYSVDDFSDAAFQLSYSKAGDGSITPEYEAVWVPKQVLRKDKDNNIWMLKDFYDQVVEEEKYLKKNNKRRMEVLKK